MSSDENSISGDGIKVTGPLFCASGIGSCSEDSLLCSCASLSTCFVSFNNKTNKRGSTSERRRKLIIVIRSNNNDDDAVRNSAK